MLIKLHAYEYTCAYICSQTCVYVHMKIGSEAVSGCLPLSLLILFNKLECCAEHGAC